jgi:hypothetical protein
MDYRANHHAAKELTMHEGTRAFPRFLRGVPNTRQFFPLRKYGKQNRLDASLDPLLILPVPALYFDRLALQDKAFQRGRKDFSSAARRQVSVGKKTVIRLPHASV